MGLAAPLPSGFVPSTLNRDFAGNDLRFLPLFQVHKICYVHVYVNIGFFVNTNSFTRFGLEQALAAKLEELLRSVPWLRSWRLEAGSPATGCDLRVTLPLPQRRAVLAVRCKKE